MPSIKSSPLHSLQDDSLAQAEERTQSVVAIRFDDLPNDLTHEDIAVSPKYCKGFRSLGSEVSTDKAAEEPARLQDLENTTERAGRAQDKEDLMERLRDLGYM